MSFKRSRRDIPYGETRGRVRRCSVDSVWTYYHMLNYCLFIIRMRKRFRDWCLCWYNENDFGPFEEAPIEYLKSQARESSLSSFRYMVNSRSQWCI